MVGSMKQNQENRLAAIRLPIPGCDSWPQPEGSRFGDLNLWWSQGRRRAHPHEGVDFIAPPGPHGIAPAADPTTIRAIAPGVLVAKGQDFLGTSLWLRHPLAEPTTGGWLHSVYGHLQPHPELALGQELAVGAALGTVAFGQTSREVPSHLHFSLAWLAAALRPAELNWETIQQAAPGCFFDPLPWLQLHSGKIS